MDLDLVFIGTSASTPTPQRGLSSVMLRRGGHRILVDCGEGTQRQMMRSTGLSELDAILITHLHADHILGLPGLLKTYSLHERSTPLIIAGPKGFRDQYVALHRIIGRLSYKVELHEVEPGWEFAEPGFRIDAFATHHSVPSVGYRLVEDDRPGRFDIDTARRLGVPEGPDWGVLQRGGTVTLESGETILPEHVLGETRSGRTVVVTGDTMACEEVVAAAHGADVLVHEATFDHADEDRARVTRHSTARDAALTALAAQVKLLAISHLSSRYSGRELLDEAREVFPNTVCPRDFDLIDVPFAERGVPELVKNGGKWHTPHLESQPAPA